MSDKLQQAIQATRAGDSKNAQFLLTQAIQDDPDNPQAWYLLSLLVDDKEKKQTYLTKVLDLDPDHAKAHEQLVTVTTEMEVERTTIPLSSGSSDLAAQDDGETLPDWMADDLPPTDGASGETEEVTAILVDKEPVPDWLDGSIDEDWDQEEEAGSDDDAELEKLEDQEDEKPAAVEKEVSTKVKKPAKEKKEKSEKQLNYLLIGLIIIAIIIFFIMAYMIFNMM